MNGSGLAQALVAILIGVVAQPLARAAGDASDLTGTDWVLNRLSGSALGDEHAITIRFEAHGELSGDDGCNRYRGSYRVDGSSIRISDNIAATRRACGAEVERRAARYAATLVRAASFASGERRLTLRDASGNDIAVFDASAPALHGSMWEVTAYNNGRQAVVSILAGTRVTARFGSDGRITGSAGCNEYFAEYHVAGQSITIGPPGSTRKFCAEPPGAMDQELLYLQALASAATLRFEGNARLILRTAAGAIAVTFARARGQAMWFRSAPDSCATEELVGLPARVSDCDYAALSVRRTIDAQPGRLRRAATED